MELERLDLRLVQYFVAVAEELHFGRAAQRLRIAQPSLSHQIRRLEQQLGLVLMHRSSRGVRLTPAGEVLLDEGRQLLDRSRRVVRLVQAAGAGRVTIGFHGSAGGDWLPRILEAHSAAHPDVAVGVRDLALGRIDGLLAGEVDVLLTRLLPGQADIEIEILAREPRVLALAAGHRLAGRGTLRFADLRDERFVINPIVGGARPPARWLREQVRHGLPGHVAAEAASIAELLTLVASGRGVCLVPESLARHHPRADIVYVALPEAEPAVVSLAWPRGSLAPAAEDLVATARRLAASPRRVAG